MKASWQYSSSFAPPSPVVEVTLCIPWADSAPVVSSILQIDSGSDITGIPRDLLLSLGARPVGIYSVCDFEQTVLNLPVYEIAISLAGKRFEIKVLAIASQIGFIGRDLLNSFQVTLDGLNGNASFG
jgi:predicted aspartyl protease